MARDRLARIVVGHTPRQEVYLSRMPPAPLLTRPVAYEESNGAQQMNMQLAPAGRSRCTAVLSYRYSIQTGCG